MPVLYKFSQKDITALKDVQESQIVVLLVRLSNVCSKLLIPNDGKNTLVAIDKVVRSICVYSVLLRVAVGY